MSRCFPYPPPGYEAGPRSEERHKDLLKKEKHKEKKHRKEKNRRKRERKERDKDYRKDKHTKKRKREKHRERSKNNHRYRDKNQTLRQETPRNYGHGNRKPEASRHHESVKDIKPTDELATRIFGQESHTEHKYNNSSVLFPWSTDNIDTTGSKENERIFLGRMVQKSAQVTQDNHGMVMKSDRIADADIKGMGKKVDSKTKIKNGKGLQDGSAEMHSKTRRSCNGVGVWRDNSDTQRMGICNGVGVQLDNSDTQRSSEGIHTASSVVTDLSEEQNGRTTPTRRPNTVQRVEQTGQDPDTSFHYAKVKNDRISTKATLEKKKQSANNFSGNMNQQFARNKDRAVEGKANGNYCMGVEGKDRDSIVKKRKTGCKNKEREVENNGTVNEQKHEYLSDMSQHEHQDNYTNGITGSHHLEKHMPSVSSSVHESSTGYLRQPHPDTKYLSQVYSIPSTQYFSEYIDQGWLFSKDNIERKTAKIDAAGSRQVWSDAQLIDTADVVALPYVVPL